MLPLLLNQTFKNRNGAKKSTQGFFEEMLLSL